MIRSEHPNKFIWTANNYRWQRNDGTIIKGCEKFLEYNVTINMRGQAVTLNFISEQDLTADRQKILQYCYLFT